MVSSFLNVLFQNIYSFFIGNRAGLAPLGYYTQADKWSKMGISSLSQVLTSSFFCRRCRRCRMTLGVSPASPRR